MDILIKAGGFYSLAFAIYHCLFWKIFQWDIDLKKVSFLNRAIMQVLNLCLTFCFLLFAYVSLFHTKALVSSDLGTALLVGISMFWLLRAIEQVVFFKLTHWLSKVFTLVFLAGAAIYMIPVLYQP